MHFLRAGMHPVRIGVEGGRFWAKNGGGKRAKILRRRGRDYPEWVFGLEMRKMARKRYAFSAYVKMGRLGKTGGNPLDAVWGRQESDFFWTEYLGHKYLGHK